MHIKIKQLTAWRAQGHEAHEKRTLVSVVVKGSSLGALEPRAEVGTERSQSPASIAESSRENLELQIAAGTGTRYELVVPQEAVLTVKTDTMEVQHFLVVKLKMECSTSPPDRSTPLQIHRPSDSAARVQPGTGSLVPIYPEIVPSAAATTTEVGGNGDGVSASVPQGAIAMGYQIDRPQQELPAQ